MITVDNHVGGVHPTKHGPLKVVKGASAQTSEAFVVPAFGIQLTLSGRRDGIIITYWKVWPLPYFLFIIFPRLIPLTSKIKTGREILAPFKF